jgi:hypothetical protein
MGFESLEAQVVKGWPSDQYFFLELLASKMCAVMKESKHRRGYFIRQLLSYSVVSMGYPS